MDTFIHNRIAFIREATLHPNKKLVFFIFLGLMTFTVFVFVEWPLITVNDAQHQRLLTMKWLLFPHVFFGLISLISGPFQFSSAIRKKNVVFHRRLGKIYVFSVFFAAFLAVLVNLNFPIPGQTTRATFETIIQASVWFVTTFIAWLTAMNRQIVIHKIWMSRSYGMTFIFTTSRIVFFIPFFAKINFNTFTIFLWFLIVFALIVPEIILNYKQIFLNPTKRKTIQIVNRELA